MGLRRFTILISLLPVLTQSLECYNFAANRNPSSSSPASKTCSATIHVKADVDKALTSNAYLNCKQLTTLTFDNDVNHIGDQAFKGCINLKSASLPTSLTYIGSHCFQDCISLTSIHIPDSVHTMLTDCFENCTSLTTVHIPSSLNKFEDCFVFCDKLSSFTFTTTQYQTFNANNVYWSTYKSSTSCLLLRTTLDKSYTYGSLVYTSVMIATRSTTSLDMPSYVEMSIEPGSKVAQMLNSSNAVSTSTSTTTTIRSPVLHIGIMAYRYTFLQGTLSIPNHILHLDQDSLGYLLQTIDSLTIPASVYIIDSLAFRDSNGLKSFSVNSQNQYFYGHDNSIYNKDNLLMFYPTNNQNTRIILSKDIKGFSHNTFASGSVISEFALPTDALYLRAHNPTTITINSKQYHLTHTLLTKDGLTLVRVAPNYRPTASETLGTADSFYKVPDGVLTIGDNAFANSKIGYQSLTSNININSATYLGSWCFYQAWFRYLYPSMMRITYCGDHAFHGSKIRGLSMSNKLSGLTRHMCSYTYLEAMTISSDSKITVIEDNFACNSQHLHTFKLPNNVEYIYNSAFKLTNLTEVILPSSVRLLDKGAFASIYALQKIVIPYGCSTVDSDAFGTCTLLEIAIIENCNTCAHPFSFRSANEKLQPTCIATFYFTNEYKWCMYRSLIVVRLFCCLLGAL